MKRRIIHCKDGIAVAEIGAVCVVIWRDAVTWPRFQMQKSGLDEVVAKHPDRAGFLCIVEPSADPPNDELRRASSDMVDAHAKRLRCMAGVIEGTGFRPAMIRSVLSGITLLTSKRSNHSYHSTVTAAVAWMGQHVDVERVDQFAEAVEAVRIELDEAMNYQQAGAGQ